MAFLQSQIDAINALVADATITETQALDLFSSPNGFTAAQVTFIQGLGLTTATEELLLAENRSTQEQIEEEIAQAKTYLKAGNYVEARRWVVIAEMTMGSMSDYQLGNRKIEYREGIRFIQNGIEKLEAVDTTTGASKQRVVKTRYRQR